MKIYKLENPDKSGLLRVSLVKDPAIEATLMAFNSEADKMIFAQDDKQIIFAPALIPNKLIFRKDVKGEPAKVFFDADTIAQIHLDGARNGYDKQINLQHAKDNTDGIFCFESWIVQDPKNDKAAAMGFDVPAGTLMKGYKIDNAEVWSQIKSGEITGLSIEAMLRPADEQIQQFNTQTLILNSMTKKNLLEKAAEAVKSFFAADPGAELAPGVYGKSLDMDSIVTDADGNPLANFEFEADGNKYKTDEMGAIMEVEPVEPAPDNEPDEKDAQIADLMAENEALKTELADLKAKYAETEATMMAAETAKMEFSKEVDDNKAKIEKLEAELVEAKKAKPNAIDKKYEEMSNFEKMKFNRQK